jgi:hypothetical protein
MKAGISGALPQKGNAQLSKAIVMPHIRHLSVPLFKAFLTC